MTRIKGQLTKSEYLPIDEFYRLVDSLHNDGQYFYELYCRLSFCTALRASDILPLRWTDVLNKHILIIIEKKTGKRRRIRFNDSVVDKIAELYILLGSPNMYYPIFRNVKTGKPYTLESVNMALKILKKRYNLPIQSFSTHSFRKTFGRYIWEKNGKNMESLFKLSQALNHDNPKTTMIYLGISQDEIDELYDSIQF